MDKLNMQKSNEIIVTDLRYVWEDRAFADSNSVAPKLETLKWCILLFSLDGKNTFEIGGEKYFVSKNDILFIPSNTKYTSECLETSTGVVICFSSSVDFWPAFSFTTEKSDEYMKLFSSCLDAFKMKNFGYETEILSKLYRIINMIIKEHIYGDREVEREYKKIKKSLVYIHENYLNHDINVPTVAKMSNVSEAHFRRIFKKVFNETPLLYIRNLQLEKAKELLTHTEYTVSEIAYETGFCDSSCFCKYFKKVLGISPVEYRKSER